jgi:hypothetical protein
MSAQHNMTGREICAVYGMKEDTARQRNNTRLTGKWSLNRVYSDSEISILLEAKPKSQTKQATKNLPAKPENKPEKQEAKKPKTEPKKRFDIAKFRTGLVDVLCAISVIGHGVLVWFDCWELWGKAGFIGGGLAFVIILIAFTLATDSSKNRTSENAMWFVLLVDLAAWKVHFDTFIRFSNVGEIVTGCLCAFLCACSFMALYIFRDSKLT